MALVAGAGGRRRLYARAGTFTLLSAGTSEVPAINVDQLEVLVRFLVFQ